jgi:anti-sigma B factor antagonist
VRVDVEATQNGCAAVVAPHGEVDLAGAPRLREALSDALSDGLVNLLIDLRSVTFIDSTGLGVLVGAGKKAYGLGGSVRIVCDNPRILKLLAVTGISRSLPVLATFEEATADWP